MERMPPEILAQIIEASLYNGTFAQYSTVSRAWRDCVEQLTFRSVKVRTDRLDQFIALVDGSNASRWAIIRRLDIVFVLPSLPDAGCCVVVQQPDRQIGSAAFSAGLVDLFNVLADLVDRLPRDRPLSLRFEQIRRLNDDQGRIYGTNIGCWKVPLLSRGEHSKRETREAYARLAQFELLHGTELRTLRGITSFEHFAMHDGEDLKASWIPCILAKLPDVTTLSLCGTGGYTDGRLRRIDRKACFISSLFEASLDHLHAIDTYSGGVLMGNENLPVHRLVEEQHDQELWSRLMVHFSSFQNLTVLQLRGHLIICPEFFRALIDAPGIPFPGLIEFELHFAVETANEQWFYEGDDGPIERARQDPEWDEYWAEVAEDEADRQYRLHFSTPSEDSDHHERVYGDEPFRTGLVESDVFRISPSKAIFLPFLLDAAEAMRCMPVLKKFILKLGGPSRMNHPFMSRIFELWYLKAGMPRSSRRRHPMVSSFVDPYVPGDAVNVNHNRLYWRTGSFEIWEEVQAAWRLTAGQDCKVTYMDEDRWLKSDWTNDIPACYFYGYLGDC